MILLRLGSRGGIALRSSVGSSGETIRRQGAAAGTILGLTSLGLVGPGARGQGRSGLSLRTCPSCRGKRLGWPDRVTRTRRVGGVVLRRHCTGIVRPRYG